MTGILSYLCAYLCLPLDVYEDHYRYLLYLDMLYISLKNSLHPSVVMIFDQ